MEKETNTFKSIFSMGFLFAFSIAIPTYIISTFLSGYMPEKLVGLLYTIGSILTIISLIWIPILLKKIGNFKTTSLFLICNIVALLLLAFYQNLPIIILAFVTHLILTTIILFNLDIFLEHLSSDSSTGHIRGSFLSITNTAWLISPLIAGFILNDHDYWKIFLLSAIITTPILFLLSINFKKFKDPEYKQTPVWETIKTIYSRKNVFRIFFAQFILRFFYSWMIIYMPIYLYQYVGFEWNIIGIIFTIMLLPFVLLEFPLGRIADDLLGEKEILNVGFLIMALSTILISFITSTSPIAWAIILFTTRVGASMVEISSESYFFKKISSRDTNILSVFRMMRPVAYTIGPLVASILLFFTEFKNLFLALGIIILVGGLTYGLKIKDTK